MMQPQITTPQSSHLKGWQTITDPTGHQVDYDPGDPDNGDDEEVEEPERDPDEEEGREGPDYLTCLS